MRASPVDGGSGLTPRRHTLSSRIAIMCSGLVGVGAQHPPGPGPRRARAESQSSSLRLSLAALAGGTVAAAISGQPAPSRSVTWPRAGYSRGFGSDLLGPQLPGTPPDSVSHPGTLRDLRRPWQSASSLRPTQQLDPAL